MALTIKEGLEEFWYEYLSNRTEYPCLLSDVELSEEDIEQYGGYPLIKFSILEVNTTSEGYLTTRKIDEEIIEEYVFNAEYMLELQVYFKSDKPFNLDKLLYDLSNENIFTRYTMNKENEFFRDMALRGKLKIVNINNFLQNQSVSRYSYQQNFIIDILRNDLIPRAKKAEIIEIKEGKF